MSPEAGRRPQGDSAVIIFHTLLPPAECIGRLASAAGTLLAPDERHRVQTEVKGAAFRAWVEIRDAGRQDFRGHCSAIEGGTQIAGQFGIPAAMKALFLILCAVVVMVLWTLGAPSTGMIVGILTLFLCDGLVYGFFFLFRDRAAEEALLVFLGDLLDARRT